MFLKKDSGMLGSSFSLAVHVAFGITSHDTRLKRRGAVSSLWREVSSHHSKKCNVTDRTLKCLHMAEGSHLGIGDPASGRRSWHSSRVPPPYSMVKLRNPTE